MSNGARHLPSFGISKKPRVNIDVAAEAQPAAVDIPTTNNSQAVSTPIVSKNVYNPQPTPIVSKNIHNTAATVTTNTPTTSGTASLKKDGRLGDIVFNDKDGLLYYFNGKEWTPLAIMDDDMRHLTESLAEILNIKDTNTVVIEAPPRGNIHLIAGNNPPGAGGHVLVSAGQGGLADGEIYFTVGGEKAVTVTKNADVIVNAANMQVDRGDLVIKCGNLEFEDPISSINCNIARAEITAQIVARENKNVEETTDTKPLDSTITSPLNVFGRGHNLLHTENNNNGENNIQNTDDPVVKPDLSMMTKKDPSLWKQNFIKIVPDAILNGMSSILTVNLELEANCELSGKIKNSIVRANSWINVTVAAESGSPYVWLGPPADGELKYTIRCLSGKLSKVQLHVEVRNSI